MPRRKTRARTRRPSLWLPRALIFATALAAGYLWRSYAPLPLPGGGRLAGDTPARIDPDQLAERTREKKQKLQAEIRQLQDKQEETQEDLGEIQIREILGGKM